MTVTEFALFTLRDSYDPVELLERLMECQERLDDWVRAHHPNDCAKKASVSCILTDETRAPHRILMTARWRSPAAHDEWTATPERKALAAGLSKFLVPPAGDDDDGGGGGSRRGDPPASALLFHLEPAGRRAHLQGAFGPCQGELVVLRLAAADRSRLQASYGALEDALAAETPVDRIWAGWRVERDGGQDELVVFHLGDLQSERLAPLKEHAKLIDELHVTEMVKAPKTSS